MKCPYCKSDNIKVNGHYKHRYDGNKLIRHRICLSCGEGFTTREEYSKETMEEVERCRTLTNYTNSI